MKAAVLRKFNEDLVIENLVVPELMEGQVLVDIKFSGICGAQVNQKKGVKIEEKFLPCLMGHEGSGIVLEIGPNVSKVKTGDHVVLHWRKSSGIDSEFPKYFSETSNETIGAGLITTFSEESVISENRLTKIDKEYPLDVASLLGCGVTTGIGIINNELNVSQEDSYIIAGVGGVGLSAILGASLNSPSKVIALDLNDEKLKFANKIGSTHEINIKKEKNFVNTVNDITENIGVNYAIDTTGNAKIIDNLLDIIRPGGSLILVGQPQENEDLVISNFLKLYKGINILDSQGGLTNPEKEIPKLLNLYKKNQLNLDLLISKKIPLDDINSGFDILENHSLVGSRIVIEN